MSRCPSPETLGRLADDSRDGSCLAVLEAHVEACPDCQSMLERLAAEVSDAGGPAPIGVNLRAKSPGNRRHEP